MRYHSEPGRGKYALLTGGKPRREPAARRERSPSKALVGAFLVSLLLFPFLFPDGRFVPRWTRFLAGFLGLGAFVALFFGGGSASDPPDSLGMVIVVGLLAGAVAQIYRYLRVSDPVQRQQTKWVV